MHLYHFYHSHRLQQLRHSGFWLYELSIWLHTFAFSLVNIFIPILLLKAGYSLQSIIGYYILLNTFDVPLNFVARKLVHRLGARFVIGAGTLAAVVFFWIFNDLTSLSWQLLLVLAFLAAIYDSFYWVAHFYFFTSTGGTIKQAAKSTSFMYAVREVALMLGPVAGAGILIFVNEHALLYFAIAILILSMVPLGHMEDFPDKPHKKSLSFMQFFKPAHSRRAFISTALYAVHDTAETVLFPVFIFLILGSLSSVAVIPILLSCTAVIATLFLGRVRPEKRQLAIVLGALAIAAFWATRLSTSDPLIYYATVLIVGVCIYFIIVPVDAQIFEYGKEVDDTLTASMYRNVAFMLTNVFLYGALALFLEVFEFGFAMAGAAMLTLVVVNIFALRTTPQHRLM